MTGSDPIAFGAVILITITSVFILISHDWRYSIIALLVQYIGVFILVRLSWPIELAITKMVAGWMAGAILGIAMITAGESWQESGRTIKFGPLFRILAATIIGLTVTSLAQHSESWLAMIGVPIRWASFFLITISLLQISLTSHPLRVIIGLLSLLSGFEIIYAAVESSTLVTGLLAGVNLGLALVGAYLLLAPTMEAYR